MEMYTIIVLGSLFASLVLAVLEITLWGLCKLNIGPNLSPIKIAPRKLSIGLYEYRGQNKSVSTTSHNVTYPSKKNEKLLRIAIFGGSAAAGYTSERSIAEILAVYLKGYEPETELFVANYALNGCSFHKGQARILKSVVDAYDIFIIYAGNNEGTIYYSKKGVWSGKLSKDQTYPDSIILPRIESEKAILQGGSLYESIADFINMYSRVYAVATRIISKTVSFLEERTARIEDATAAFVTPTLHATQTKNNPYLHPQAFRTDPIVPRIEFRKLVERFSDDLDEICTLLECKNKILLYSNVVSNESSPPFFSVIDGKWSEGDIEHLNLIANQAQTLIEKSDFMKVIQLISEKIGLNNDMSIFNFQLGCSYKALGDLKRSHRHYRKSIDCDGFYFRSRKEFHDAAKAVTENHKNAFFVDTISEFQSIVDKGWSWDTLYNDVNHASFFGNAIIAKNIFNHLIYSCRETSQDKVGEIITQAHNISIEDLKILSATMEITQKERVANKFLVARWYIGLSIASAYPDYFLDFASIFLDQYEDTLDDTEDYGIALVELYRSLISIKRGEINKACEQGNTAFSKQPKLLRDIMSGRGSFVHSLPVSEVSEVYDDSPVFFSPISGFSVH